MLHKISNNITNYLITENYIKSEKQTWCIYLIEKKLIQYTALSITMLIGSIFFSFYECLLFTIFFTTLRKYAGGYHAKSPSVCIISSIFLLLICIYFSRLLVRCNIIFVLVASIISFTLLFLFAPINHPNMHYSLKEYIAVKNRLHFILNIYIAILLISYLYFKTIFRCLLIAIIAVTFTVLIAKILKQEVKPNENHKRKN